VSAPVSYARSRVAGVTTVHQLSRQDARRIAVRAQLLDADRPTDLQDVVRALTLLQVDQVQVVAPSADARWLEVDLSLPR
jgi:hypothetical protein